MILILISGPPASGKTSFAEYLSNKMEVPLFSKDRIKEILFDTIGFNNRQEKNKLGIAATDIMIQNAKACLKVGKSVILESNFENATKEKVKSLLDEFHPKIVGIRFIADIDVLYDRFIERDKSKTRHRGHVVNTVYPELKDGSSVETSITRENFAQAIKKRGMMEFTMGGIDISVDSTDLNKISYETIYEEIMININ